MVSIVKMYRILSINPYYIIIKLFSPQDCLCSDKSAGFYSALCIASSKSFVPAKISCL